MEDPCHLAALLTHIFQSQLLIYSFVGKIKVALNSKLSGF